jgi:Na+/melibiose symporter-like transporter
MAGSSTGRSVPLPLWRASLFSLSGLPVAAVTAAVLIYLPNHLATRLGVSLAVVSVAFMAIRLIDIGVDPILGMLMDRTHTRLGRYRPWMLVGAPIFMAATYMLFFAPMGIGWTYLVGWLLTLYVGMSILALAAPAWASTLAPTYNQRSRLYGVMAVMAIVALLVTISIPTVAGQVLKRGDADAVHGMGWFLTVLTPVAVGIAVFSTPEPRRADAHTLASFGLGDVAALLRKRDLLRLYAAQICMVLGPGWTSSIFLFFAKDYMHFTQGQASMLLLVYIVSGLAGAPATAWLATRIGKHRAIMTIAITYSLGVMTILLPPKGVVLASIPVNLWCGFWGAGFELTLRSMLADVADEVRLEGGRDRLSLIFALSAASAKAATAFAIVISFRMLDWVGYAPKLGHANSPDAIRGLGLTFVAGPIGFVILGAVCMLGWKLTGARHAEIRLALDQIDEAVALGTAAEPIAEQALADKASAA